MKNFLKKTIVFLLCFGFLVSLPGCSFYWQEPEDCRLRVVSSVFPTYDFARQIAGDRISLSMLLRPGTESHSYEPTAKDMIALEHCDVFLCTGGEGDQWVEQLLGAVSNPNLQVVRMVDCVPLLEEEAVEGMLHHHEEEEHSEHGEFDEHVWASPVNAAAIAEEICAVFCEKDPDNALFYQTNMRSYHDELMRLDSLFRGIVSGSSRKTLVVGDRFPFRYLVEEYGLSYFAAFPGCASDTGASASAIAFLVEKVKAEGIPAVFHIEFSNCKIAGVICEETGAELLEFHSCHNVSADDFSAGVTYLDLMRRNAENLREALN